MSIPRNGVSVMQVMAYDGGGSRVLKQRELKAHGQSDWVVDNTTHYTGIGTELRVDKDFNKKVVVNMPQGMGRYGADDAVNSRGNGRSFELSHNPSSFQFLALQGPGWS